MFPIANLSRRYIGFGARALKPGDEPKYLNSPETEVYHKGSVLYGLNWTRREIDDRDCAIVVEGYMDLLALAQAGIGHVVASSGTALGEQQCHTICRFLVRYARRVVLVFDGDAAGSAAAMRGLEVLIGAGLDVQVVPLPGDDDPDSFVRREGAGRFEQLVDEAQSAIDFYIGRLAAEIDLQTMAGKMRAIERVVPLIANCNKEVARNFMLRQVAQRLKVDERALRDDMGKTLDSRNLRARTPAGGTAGSPLLSAATGSGAGVHCSAPAAPETTDLAVRGGVGPGTLHRPARARAGGTPVFPRRGRLHSTSPP